MADPVPGQRRRVVRERPDLRRRRWAGPGWERRLKRISAEEELMDDNNVATAASGTIELGGDLTVRRMGFGAMRLTGPGIWGEPRDRDEAKAVLRRAIELGVNFIDTADSYGPDVSEELIAEALHPYPEDLVIATKGGLERTGPNRWPSNAHPEHLKEACDGSLR